MATETLGPYSPAGEKDTMMMMTKLANFNLRVQIP